MNIDRALRRARIRELKRELRSLSPWREWLYEVGQIAGIALGDPVWILCVCLLIFLAMAAFTAP